MAKAPENKVTQVKRTLGPGVIQVATFIETQIAKGNLRPGSLLPARADLARTAKVGTKTVSRAIGLLKNKGVLSGVRGQRAKIASAVIHRAQDAGTELTKHNKTHKNRSWDRVADSIKEDIVSGKLTTKKGFPATKELQVHYTCSYLTIRKALESLVEEGFIERRASRYTIKSIDPSVGASSLVFLWVGGSVPLLPGHPMDMSFILSLERECNRNLITLDKLIILKMTEGEPVLIRHLESETVDANAIRLCSGIVYLVSWPGCIDPEILGWLNRLHKPVSIIDWLGGWELPVYLAKNKNIQLSSSVASKQSGFNMGRYLVNRGHRHIGYFAPSATRWPAERLKGLYDAGSLMNAEIHTFIPEKLPAEEALYQISHEWHLALYNFFDNQPGLGRAYKIGIDYLLERAWIFWENRQYYSLMEPLFEQALLDKRITAWVGCIDFIAGMAKSFLMSHKVNLSQKIAIAGFGNTLETAKLGMTSYEFDLDAAAHAAINFLMRPDFAQTTLKLTRPRVEGFIVERESTQSVPVPIDDAHHPSFAKQ